MKKSDLVHFLSGKIEEELVGLKAAAKATYDAATNEESRPENEYDTRALEASYLAGAQAARVQDMEKSLKLLKYLELKEFPEGASIQATALVQLDFNGKTVYVFLIPVRGVVNLSYDSKIVQIVTPQSPLGEALLGLKVGDVALVDKAEQTLEYEVLAIE